MEGLFTVPSEGLQVGVRQHQPFGARVGKVDLNARLGAVTLRLQDHAVAEFGMSDTLPQLEAATLGRCLR